MHCHSTALFVNPYFCHGDSHNQQMGSGQRVQLGNEGIPGDCHNYMRRGRDGRGHRGCCFTMSL